jgi:hypothetical protein
LEEVEKMKTRRDIDCEEEGNILEILLVRITISREHDALEEEEDQEGKWRMVKTYFLVIPFQKYSKEILIQQLVIRSIAPLVRKRKRNRKMSSGEEQDLQINNFLSLL